MSLGVIMLVHSAFNRAEAVARYWADAGCPVVIHVDANVSNKEFEAHKARLADRSLIRFSERYRCEWGTWGIVAATQEAAAKLLNEFEEPQHVFLMSGSCLPLRPADELIEYLSTRTDTDFIESATTTEVSWTMGGLEEERFDFFFPVAWKKNRFLFDRLVAMQRLAGVKRRRPNDLVPHIGSQWWCLTRETISGILADPDRRRYERFFRSVWIPDECYFQTRARDFSRNIESRSLTLSKFDYQGKPHLFYDDHLPLLRQSDCFVARKIWAHADVLYDEFLKPRKTPRANTEPDPARINRVFSKALERRTKGRPGLYMQSRFPRHQRGDTLAARPYTKMIGFAPLFENLEGWLARETTAQIHGHLFAPDRVHFAQGRTMMQGGLSDSARLRDYNPEAFLTSLIWNTRGTYQCFQFGPADNQVINWPIAKDANARIWMVTGAWAVPLFRLNPPFEHLRREAARLQKIESLHLKVLKSPYVKAKVDIRTLAEFLEDPMDPLMAIVGEIGKAETSRLTEAPKMVDLTGFEEFLKNLQNQGMHPHLTGDFPIRKLPRGDDEAQRPKPYIVR